MSTAVLKAYEQIKDYLEESSKHNYADYIKERDILKILNDFREASMEEGWEDGRESRSEEFYDEAFSDGYDEGYEEGKSDICKALREVLAKFD